MRPKTEDEMQYRHPEAFCLMPYVCERCRAGEWLYNTRDGVTPFMVGCIRCDRMMSHASFRHDIRVKVGETLKRDMLVNLHGVNSVWHDILCAQFAAGGMDVGQVVRGNFEFQIPDGMRVFVDLTLEKAALSVERRLFEHPEYSPEEVQSYCDPLFGHQTEHDPDHPCYEAFIKYRNEIARSDARVDEGGGQPTVETWPILGTGKAA